MNIFRTSKKYFSAKILAAGKLPAVAAVANKIFAGAVFAGLLCLPTAVFAEGEAAADATEMPLVYTLSMFGLVLSLFLLFASAYVIVSIRGIKKKLGKVNSLERDVKALTKEVHSMRAVRQAKNDDDEPEIRAELPPESKTVGDTSNIEKSAWLPFVEEYNKLADSLKAPMVNLAVQEFIEKNNVKALMCLDHTAQPSPRFVAAEETTAGNFWVWSIPNNKGRYVVVPNLAFPYGENLHFEGGMKETFASNYEELRKVDEGKKDYNKMTVKLPAIFVHDDETAPWIIEQPGLINVA